ncbi:hypothetical protein CR513_49299, partial [Mucuna pruriens]
MIDVVPQWGINEDITHRIQMRLLKWRKTLEVICDHKVPTKLKDKFYCFVIRLTILYGNECWTLKEQHKRKGRSSRNEIFMKDVSPHKKRQDTK